MLAYHFSHSSIALAPVSIISNKEITISSYQKRFCILFLNWIRTQKGNKWVLYIDSSLKSPKGRVYEYFAMKIAALMRHYVRKYTPKVSNLR